MSDTPWLKFYPRDWRGDQALRAVSIAARGLWIECLCIMHEAKPYGHLVLNGEPVEGDVLARMTGIPVDEVLALLAELRQAGVLSVTSRGVVFSRRMTKDHARARKGRKAAKKRWLQVPDDVEQSGAPNGSPNGSPTTQKPEAREKGSSDEEPNLRPKPPKRRHSYTEQFQEFWEGYPTDPLMSKLDASKAFERLGGDDKAAALKALPAFVAYCRAHPDYRPVHANRYLTSRRFDGFLKSQSAQDDRVFVKMGTETWQAIMRRRGVVSMAHVEREGQRGFWFSKSEIAAAEREAQKWHAGLSDRDGHEDAA